MIRVKGRYRNATIELAESVNLPDGTVVEVVIHPAGEDADDAWRDLGMERLEREWDNERDAIYDDWRRLYGIQQP
jgi:hypothetical protein